MALSELRQYRHYLNNCSWNTFRPYVSWPPEERLTATA